MEKWRDTRNPLDDVWAQEQALARQRRQQGWQGGRTDWPILRGATGRRNPLDRHYTVARHHDQGIGGHLLRNLLAEAAIRQLPVRLQVAVGNPAQRLYRRLDFAPSGPADVYQAMKWRPSC